MTRTVDESFEGAGYEEAWTAVISTGSADPDYAIPGSPPTGAGSQCFRITKAATTGTDYLYRDIAEQPVTFSRAYIHVVSESLANGETFDTIFRIENASNGGLINALLGKSSEGQLQLTFNYRQSAWTTLGPPVSIATGQWYCVELGYRTDTLAVSAWVNDALVASATADSMPQGPANRLVLGPRWAGEMGNARTLDVCYDLVAVDDSTRVGPQVAAAALEGASQSVSTLTGVLAGPPAALAGDAQGGATASGTLAPNQIAAPIADISAGAWTPSSGGSLYPMLDEAVADDNDYISVGSTGSFAELRLAPLTDPNNAGPRTLRYRLASPSSATLRLTLMQGAAQIAQWTEAMSPTWTTHAHTLSAPEAAAITNYTDLRVRVEVL